MTTKQTSQKASSKKPPAIANPPKAKDKDKDVAGIPAHLTDKAPIVKVNDKPAEVPAEQRAAEKKGNVDVMAFAVQQLSAPAQLSTPPAVLDTFQEELKALQLRHGIAPTAVKIAKPKVDKVQRNGITRPAVETLCGKIWAACDELSGTSHGVATIAALKIHPAVVSVNGHTIKTQYARWRQFNGVTGRLPKITSVHQVAGEYDGLQPIA
jgi:hypothetical protein